MSWFWAFVGVSIIVIVTPGPDTAITIRNTLLGGRRAGILTGLGVSTGLSIWAITTSAGLVALLVASKPLFLAVKYAGAAYLVFLGLQGLVAAFGRRGGLPHRAPTRSAHARPGAFAAYRQGLISDLSNPKIAVFFASLLPQFVPAGELEFLVLLFLGAVFSAMTFTWLAVYAIVVGKAGDFLRRPVIRRWIEGITGAVLIALGLRIAAEQR